MTQIRNWILTAGLVRASTHPTILAAAIALCSALPALAQQGPAAVSVAEVVEKEVAEGQAYVGTLFPVRKSVIGSAVDGRVLEFPMNEGDRVKKGQVLAQLRTKLLELELATATADVDVARQELAELENGSRPEEIALARAQRDGAKAVLSYAQAKHRRLQTLFERRSISEDELEEAVSAANVAAQKFHEHEATLALAEQGPRKERIEKARAHVRSLEENANRIQDQIDRHTIICPFDGYVVAEHTEIGEWVMKGAAVAEVAELDSMDIQMMVLENHVPNLRKGQQVRVEVPALPGETLDGEVALIVPQADVRSRSFPVKVRVTNREVDGVPVLKAGMLARVTLPIGKKQPALLVPKDALVLGGPTPAVLVPAPGPKDQLIATLVPVELGVTDGNLIQIKGNLKRGQDVIVRGNERLRPGTPVQVISKLGQAPPKKAAETSPSGR